MNPYRSTEVAGDIRLHQDLPSRGYYLRHAVVFFAAFASTTTFLCFILTGVAETFTSFQSDALMWACWAGIGAIAWVGHATLSTCSLRVRRVGPDSSAVVGCVGFILGALASHALASIAPDSITVPLSWVPEYISLMIYLAGSLVAVGLLAILRADNDCDESE